MASSTTRPSVSVTEAAGSSHEEMDHSSRQAFASEPEGVDDLLGTLFRSEPADINEGEPAAHAQRRPHSLTATARVKQLGIDPSAPDLDVGNLEPHQILAGDGRRSKDSAASAMKTAQVGRYRPPEP